MLSVIIINFWMWVVSRCHQDYFGERCGEKSMKTHSTVDGDLSKITLAAIAAFVSAVSFTAIAAVITIQWVWHNLKIPNKMIAAWFIFSVLSQGTRSYFSWILLRVTWNPWSYVYTSLTEITELGQNFYYLGHHWNFTCKVLFQKA